MEWAADWDERISGEACPFCTDGRPADTGRAIRFHTEASVDAYLFRGGVQEGWAMVVWRGRHVVEPTALSDDEAMTYTRAVLNVGRAMEQHFAPRKLNYQTLGNTVPHLHTLVAARRVSDDVAPGRALPVEPVRVFDEAGVQADAAALRSLMSA